MEKEEFFELELQMGKEFQLIYGAVTALCLYQNVLVTVL